jgi:hypothetical protein
MFKHNIKYTAQLEQAILFQSSRFFLSESQPPYI